MLLIDRVEQAQVFALVQSPLAHVVLIFEEVQLKAQPEVGVYVCLEDPLDVLVSILNSLEIREGQKLEKEH